jgi:hypothetical protein
VAASPSFCVSTLNVEPGRTDNVAVKRMIGVYCGQRSYRFGDIEVYPVKEFIRLLSAGEFF